MRWTATLHGSFWTSYIHTTPTLSNSLLSLWLRDHLEPASTLQLLKMVNALLHSFRYYLSLVSDGIVFSTAPSSPPIGVAGMALSSSSIFISWQLPPIEQQNGIIREYHINVTEVETGDEFSLVSYYLNAIVGSLHPYYRYNITITAVTIAPGPPSPSFVVQTNESG